jgi:DnaA N-terminal domain
MAEIVFHAGSKLSWLESIARDRGATAFDLRVSVAILNRTKGDGVARNASQAWIARYVGASLRGVRKSVEHLRSLGHLEPTRNALGEGSDGRLAFGGSGHATEYRLLRKETRSGGAGPAGETRNGETRNGEAENPERRSSKPGTAVPPFPYSSKEDSLACAGARARDGANATWLAVRARLSDEVGREVFESWFAKIALVQVEEGIVLLRPPSKFHARWLTDHYVERILRAWQAESPEIAAVRLDHRAICSATATRGTSERCR